MRPPSVGHEFLRGMCFRPSCCSVKKLKSELEEYEAEATNLRSRLHGSEEALAADRASAAASAKEQLRRSFVQEQSFEHERQAEAREWEDQKCAWEGERLHLIELEKQATRNADEIFQIEREAAQRLVEAKSSELQLAEEHVEACKSLELGRDLCLRQNQELADEVAAAKRFREEALAWRDEFLAATTQNKQEVHQLCAQKRTTSQELDTEVTASMRVREELWAEQAELVKRNCHVDSLQLELKAARDERVQMQDKMKNLEDLAHCEIQSFLSQRNKAISERDMALLARDEASHGWTEALDAQDMLQLHRDDALRLQAQERREASRKITRLKLLADDADMQLKVEREQVRRLDEEVGLCARSGAARAAASYLGCVAAGRWPGSMTGGLSLTGSRQAYGELPNVGIERPYGLS